MGLKIMMAVSMLPLLPILYGVLYYCGKEKNGILYGVTLWEGARESRQVQEIQRSYKRRLNTWALLCFLVFLATLAVDYESLMVSGQILWVFFTMAALFVPFVQANQKMMGQKRAFQDTLPRTETAARKVFVDVTAAAARKPRFFRKSLYLGCVFGTMPIVAELFLHRIWHNPQMPDLWECERVLVIMAAGVFLFPLFLFLMGKQRTHVVSGDTQVNQQFTRVRGYQWGKCCAVLAWMAGGMNWGILMAFHLPYEYFFWVVAGVGFFFSLGSLGILWVCGRRMEKANEKYEAGAFAAQDEDAYWIWGMFYYNEKDSRSMVENRTGMGLTGNMAKPKIRYGTIVTVSALFLSMVGVCAWTVAEEFTPVSLSYENGMVIAHHWKEVYRIKNSDIKSVSLLQERPDMRRRSGTAMRTVEKGDYYSSADRKELNVCLDPRQAPFLMVETKEGVLYLLGSHEGGETMEIFHVLQEEGTI